MREANVPLEGEAIGPDSSSDIILTGSIVMWNDIDLYHALRDFTTNPVSFPTDEVGAFIDELVNHRSAISQTPALITVPPRPLIINITFP